jgi:hypothetical protein
MARPFQFRLRTMFLLTAVAAVACLVGPWAVKEYRHHQRQQEMKRMIDELWKIEVDARSGPLSPT